MIQQTKTQKREKSVNIRRKRVIRYLGRILFTGTRITLSDIIIFFLI